jgi:hypothetical protein
MCFLRKEVTFLGHRISELGVEPYTRNIDPIENFSKPPLRKLLKKRWKVRVGGK